MATMLLVDDSSASAAAAPDPRIAPGTAREVGVVNSVIVRLLGLVTGGAPPNLFTTLARHRGLFRRWLLFASALMPGGALPRADSELVILRVACNTDCRYEWDQHERIAMAAGLPEQQVLRVPNGADAGGWSQRQEVLLRATDELHRDRMLSDALWQRLRGLCGEVELIELCMLVGHYEMLAMTLKTLRVAPDAGPAEPPAAMRAVGSLLARRARRGRKHL